MAAKGTATWTYRRVGTVKKVSVAWVSDASGDVSGHVSDHLFDGEIVGLVNEPDGGGTQPTALYDVYLKDAASDDVLLGAGVDCANTGYNYVARASLSAVAASTLTLTVANAGNAKGGTTILYIR